MNPNRKDLIRRISNGHRGEESCAGGGGGGGSYQTVWGRSELNSKLNPA